MFIKFVMHGLSIQFLKYFKTFYTLELDSKKILLRNNSKVLKLIFCLFTDQAKNVANILKR